MLFAVHHKKKSSRMENSVVTQIGQNSQSSQTTTSLMQSLQQALALEAKFQPKLQLPLTAAGGVRSISISI